MLSGVCLNSLLTMSQRNSVRVVIEGWGETGGMGQEEGVAFFNDRRERLEMFFDEDF